MAPIFCPETASGKSGLKACPLQQWPGYIVRGLVSQFPIVPLTSGRNCGDLNKLIFSQFLRL